MEITTEAVGVVEGTCKRAQRAINNLMATGISVRRINVLCVLKIINIWCRIELPDGGGEWNAEHCDVIVINSSLNELLNNEKP